MTRFLKLSVIIAICWSVFHLYTAAFGAFPAFVQRAIHVSFALSLAFSLFSISKNKKHNVWKIVDGVTIVLPLLIGSYLLYHADRLTSRNWFVDSVQALDLWLGIIFIILVIEVSRRTVGNVITILAVLFITYGFTGPYFSGLFRHRGLDITDTVDLLFLSPDGIFGVPIGVATDYVFYFILFGAFLKVSGGGQLFNDLAFRLTRRSKGGPAKAAVVSSALMGSISGSAVANVASTGIFTIPLMKRAGYSKKDSAAIEALASTGGQLMPPIMGAAVFIMAEMLGVLYVEIMMAALIPALLYYISIFVIVHIKASKKKIDTLQEEMAKKQEKIISRIHLLFPMVTLITLIFMGYSLQRAALWSILFVVIISYLRRATFLKFTDILSALESGAQQAIKVTIPCAIAGIIVGIIGFSGLGLNFTSLIVQWSFGNVILALILTAIGCIILGMGMPTTAAYIMAATLLAPALQNFGIHPISAHMFVLFFAVLSMITPPIALAAYSAAGISGSGTNETGVRAFVLSTSSFLIPFSFVFNPALLLLGETHQIIWSTFATMIGVVTLSSSVVGYLCSNLMWLTRIVMLPAALLMIAPGVVTDLIGMAIFVAILVFQYIKKYKGADKQVQFGSKLGKNVSE